MEPGYIMDSSRYIMVASMLAVPHLPHGSAWYLDIPPSYLCASWDKHWSTHQREASFLSLSRLLQDGANVISTRPLTQLLPTLYPRSGRVQRSSTRATAYLLTLGDTSLLYSCLFPINGLLSPLPGAHRPQTFPRFPRIYHVFHHGNPPEASCPPAEHLRFFLC